MRSAKVLTVWNLSCFIVFVTLLSYVLIFKKQDLQPVIKYQEVLKESTKTSLVTDDSESDDKLTLYTEESYQNDMKSESMISCTKLTFVQNCHVCTYAFDEDKSVSNTVIKRRKYQPALTSLMLFLLSEMMPSSKSIFLDLGANIGYFSLLASCSGYKTFTFEAVGSNVLRMYEATKRSNVQDKIKGCYFIPRSL